MRLCEKTIAAFLIFSFSLIFLVSHAHAANGKTKSASKITQKFIADVKMDGFQAEAFANITRLTWKTGFEQNVLGFKVWRDENGQRIPVNQELVAGSLLKFGNGVLPAGSEYVFDDRAGSTNVYYHLEAIQVNGQSKWFGPVYPRVSFEKSPVEAESATISRLNASGSREQIDRVVFSAAISKKGAVKNVSTLPAATADLLANNPDALKIEVRARGIYRIDPQALAEMGYGNVTVGNWRLFCNGVEQPLAVNADGSMEFFGQGVDTIQTDANIYWLTPDSAGGTRINRVTQNFQQSAQYGWSLVTAERKDKNIRISKVLNGARENWFGVGVNHVPATQTLSLNDIALNSGQTATVGVDLQGITVTTHQVTVLLNGFSIGQITLGALDRIEWTANVPLSRLVEGDNVLTLQSSGSSDVSVTEAVRITYPRSMKARNDRLDFSVAAHASVKLKGFTSPQIRVFDVTNPAQIVEYAPESRQETDGTYTVTIASSQSVRLMMAQTDSVQSFSATPLITNNPSDLRNAQNAAKFVVIAPFEYRKMLNDLLLVRNARGVPTIFVDVQDIYDEFNNGLRSAEAIRSFLQYAKQNWSVKPDFAMFVGDASVDPRNYSGQGGYGSNQVPTMFTDTWNMETVSDEMMADFDDDGVGEIAIGRLPAKNEVELEAMIEKTILAEPIPAQEISDRGVHFVSDALIGYDFAAGSRNMATFIPSNIAVNYMDAAGQDPLVMREGIVNRIGSGAAIVNYFGHASISSWTSSQIFRTADAAILAGSKKTTFMAMIDCLNGDFAETNIDGLAEAVMKKFRGGAHTVWASSGWNAAFDQEWMTRDFYKKAFTGMPLGEAARQTKMLHPVMDQRRTYVFFGDPTQPLVLP